MSFVLDDPEPVLWGGERFFRDGVCVGYTTSGAYGHTLGASVALGYLDLGGEPVTRELVESGDYEVDVAGERVGARASLRPLFDPERERILGMRASGALRARFAGSNRPEGDSPWAWCSDA